MAARCLLISANQVKIPYPVYPLGAACVLAALRDQGHEASHFDLLADGGLSTLAERLSQGPYDLIGVSIRNLDSVDSADPQEYLSDVAKLVELIRQKSKAPVVLGGPAFSIMPRKLLDFFQADYGVVGEGEKLLPWLADEIACGRPPAEKIFSSKPSQQPSWTKPAFTKEAAAFYTEHGGMLGIQTKRGCPHACAYCSYPTIEGRQMRYREPEEVADEVARLHRDFGARYIFFTDSVFNDSKGHFLEVAEALIRQGNQVPWSAYFRPQNMESDQLQLLKRAGLAAIELGTDGVTDTTLTALNKKFTFADVLAINQRVLAAEIPCAHFIMFGGPEETSATVRLGLENIEKLGKTVVFAFVGIRILPSTAIYDRAVADGIISGDQALLKPTFYFSPQVSQTQITDLVKESFGNRLDRIYPCSDFEERITMLHKMGHAGPLWDLVLGGRRRR
ncbi:MAG: lipid biosynthesis B12-binding/radical SAM protein [Thermodesulfobacteriota bacterium]